MLLKHYLPIIIGCCFLLCTPSIVTAQQEVSNEDAFQIKNIYDDALTRGQAYKWLTHLTTQIGGRLAGSPQAAAAVEYTRQMLDTLQLDHVYLQDCTVPHWVRGKAEQVRIVNSSKIGTQVLNALALGNSIGTGELGITAQVVEVQTLDEVERLGRTGVDGKIVFFNRPLDPTQINTFAAYGGAVDQRVWGASKAAEYGAVAVLVRSMASGLDDVPHTGTLVYRENIPQIPAVAISTNDAALLSRLLREEAVNVFIQTNCQKFSDKPSHSVIGEIKGSEFPDEIILVGGHLDSWDVGQGAHDDGAGCVQAMDVLHTLQRIGYRPKRTIRCVLFQNEENGLAGGLTYAKISNKNNEYHLAAIESDRGGFTPRGFSCEGDPSIFKSKYRQVNDWLPLLEPYGLTFTTGGSGADIGPLKSQKGLLIGFVPDSQRYFDYHHTAADVITAVHPRELALGVGAITSLVYLIDKYGL
ncbi:MAG: M28 family peptidase [Bacteroidota bacterium]